MNWLKPKNSAGTDRRFQSNKSPSSSCC